MNNPQEKTLLPAERLSLKKMAHHLKPVVQIGKKGITDALLSEIDSALEAHELIKIQVLPEQKALLENLSEILEKTQAVHIDTIGNIVILFRKREEEPE